MTKNFNNEIWELLDKQEQDILSALKNLHDKYSLALQAGNPEDPARTERSVDHLSRIITHYRSRLQRLRAAKDRLENGRYGLCEQCGKPISDRRLYARPDAHYCYDCVRRRERCVDQSQPRFEVAARQRVP